MEFDDVRHSEIADMPIKDQVGIFMERATLGSRRWVNGGEGDYYLRVTERPFYPPIPGVGFLEEVVEADSGEIQLRLEPIPQRGPFVEVANATIKREDPHEEIGELFDSIHTVTDLPINVHDVPELEDVCKARGWDETHEVMSGGYIEYSYHSPTEGVPRHVINRYSHRSPYSF